jgi:thioredoxin 1
MLYEVLNADELQVIREANPGKAMVLNFTAPSWCVPCQRLAPHFKTLALSRDDIVFVKIDLDEAPDLGKQFKVLTVPTVILQAPGKKDVFLVARTSAALAKEFDLHLRS